MQSIKIFISSPSDVRAERERAERVIERLAGEFADAVRLEALRWEHAYYTADRSFQDRILPPSEADLVLCIFWKRLGTGLPPQYRRPDGSLYESGTEYEFEDALSALRDRGVPDIFVYRKTADVLFNAESLAVEQAQWEKLQAFWQRWFQNQDGHFTAGFHSFETTDEFEDQIDGHLRHWLSDRALLGSSELIWPVEVKGSPFRGLEPFDEGHASVFFGRRREVEHLRERLSDAANRGCPFLLILGMSGSGKSSLARAGLLPRLTQPGAVPGIDLWRRCIVRPGEGLDPLSALAAALYRNDALPELAEGDFPAAGDLAALMRSEPVAAVRPVSRALSRWAHSVQDAEGYDRPLLSRLVLLVDQLEELFAEPCDDQAAYIAALSALVRSGEVWVVATLRSDFYPAAQAQAALMRLKEDGAQFDLLPPSGAAIGEIIRGPAQAAGLGFERRGGMGGGLDDELERAAAQPGALPLLEFTLDELFNARDIEAGRLTIAAYDSLGGLEGAIERRAEASWAALTSDQQAVFPAVLRAMVTVKAGNQPTARSVFCEAVATTPASSGVIDRFVAARLFVVSGEGRGAILRFAHEALLTRWARARDQVAADLEFLAARARVEAAAQTWIEKARNSGFLLPDGLPLAEATAMLADRREELDRGTVHFIEKSIKNVEKERDRRLHRMRLIAAGFAVLAVLSAALGWLSLKQSREAQQNFTLALDTADRLGEEVARVMGFSMRVPAAEMAMITAVGDDAFGRLSERIGDDPQVAERYARLLTAASRNRLKAGQISEGLELSARAVALAERAAGSLQQNDSLTLAEARILHAEALIASGRLEEGEDQMNLASAFSGQRSEDSPLGDEDSPLGDEDSPLGDEDSPLSDLVVSEGHRVQSLLHQARVEYVLAQEHLENALAVLGSNLDESPLRRLRAIEIYLSVAGIYNSNWRLTDAQDAIRRGMVLINELPLEDRTDPRIQHLHAKFFLTRGIVRERIDQSGALDDFERAEQLLRMLVDRDPMNRQFGLSLVITLIYKEGFLRNVNDLGLGRILWEEIRQRTESLYNLEPNWVRLRNFLIWSDVYRSRYMMHSVQTARYSDLSEEGALDVLNRSIEMHGELAEEVPLISASISALNYERGRVLASLGREEASIDAYGQSRRNFSETVESDMGARNARLYLWSLLGEGRAFRSAEQDEEGIERFLTGRRIAELAIQRAEAEGGADDYARATAINWRGDFNYQLSISYRLTGDAIAARSHILHAIDDYRLAMDLSPGTRLFHQNLAVSFYELGWVEHKAEDWSQAIEAFGESIRHLAMLVEQDFSDEWARGMLGDTVPSALESLESAMADDPETSERLFDAFDGLERQAELSLNISLRHEREETPFGDQTGWPMQPVIPGGWALHTLDMSNSLTQRIFRALEDVVDEAYEIVKIRSREIDFYPESRLIEVEVREDDLRGVVVFVEHDEELTHITGISTVIHRLNHLAPLVIDTPLKAMNYLRFFTTCIQGEHGAFTIVDHSGDLLWNDDRTLEDWVRAEEALRAFEISRGSDGAWRMYGTVVYSNAIFDAAFTVNRTGNVDMVNDSPTHAELPISVTRFVDGIRMIDHIEPVSED